MAEKFFFTFLLLIVVFAAVLMSAQNRDAIKLRSTIEFSVNVIHVSFWGGLASAIWWIWS